MRPTPIMVPMMPIPTGRSTSRLLDKVVVIGANISAVIMARFLSENVINMANAVNPQHIRQTEGQGRTVEPL